LPGAERRVTVLDANEVPVLDVRLEKGFGPTVVLPNRGSETRAFTLVERESNAPEQRRAVVPQSESAELMAQNDAVAAPRARGAARTFELLFAKPFGPDAVAALPAEKKSDEVYGVSVEERDRMRRLFDANADSARDGRFVTGSAFSAVGLIYAGSGVAQLTLYSSDSATARALRPAAATSIGMGGAFLGIGIYSFLRTSSIETQRDAFVAALREQPLAFERAVRDAEVAIVSRAEKEQSKREMASVFYFGLGTLGLAGGVAGELLAKGDGGRGLSRLAMMSGAGSVVLGIVERLVRTDAERFADLWMNEPSTRALRPRSSFKLQPTIGLGSLGLSGSF
jgi:hypothetical protein